MRTETRSIEARFQNDGNTLTGYAAVWDTPATISERGRTFTEIVRRGTFARAIAERQDVVAVVNHDENRLIGRTSSGTLTLTEDDHGLRFAVMLPQHSKDIRELVERGDLNGASFSFITKRDNWTDPQTRELLDVDLRDVSVVVRPAYAATVVAIRSKNAKRKTDLYRKLLPEE
jgi:HK97 family phage prohead protease